MNKQCSCFILYDSFPVTLYTLKQRQDTCWNQSSWMLWHARKILTEAIGLRGSMHFLLKSDRRSHLMSEMRFLTWMFVSFLSQTIVTSSTKGNVANFINLLHLSVRCCSPDLRLTSHFVSHVRMHWGHSSLHPRSNSRFPKTLVKRGKLQF